MIDEAATGVPAAVAVAIALPPSSRMALLDLAWRTVKSVAHGGPLEDPGVPPAALERPGAAFVTLRVGGDLKGCVGMFEAQPSLWLTVHQMAEAAATRDPRFGPVGVEDLDRLSIELSVLSPARPLAEVKEIEIGRHGLEVSRGYQRGVLLPQVAITHALDREEFLAETCRKAGLPAQAWQEPETSVRLFEAEVFGDDRASGL